MPVTRRKPSGTSTRWPSRREIAPGFWHRVGEGVAAGERVEYGDFDEHERTGFRLQPRPGAIPPGMATRDSSAFVTLR